jgi:hypothetical protein
MDVWMWGRYGGGCVCVDVCGCVWMCMEVYGGVWMYMDVYGCMVVAAVDMDVFLINLNMHRQHSRTLIVN